MDAIPPIFTSNGKTELCHLYISSAKLVATTRRNIVASLVIEFQVIV